MALFLPVLALLFADTSAPVRIGYGEARPYCYSQGSGRPGGFLIEVFDEAARREGLQLEWTRAGSSEQNTKALAEGRLDVLPMGAALSERRRLLFVSDPWWSEESILLVRGDRKDVNPSKPARVAMPVALLPGARVLYRDSQPVITVSASQALEQVCRNTADAALLGATYIRQLVNARPQICEAVPLRIFDSHVKADFAIIANRGMRTTAERLRGRVTEMTADGTLARIAGHHPPISTPHAARMAEDLRATYEQQRLRTLLIFLSVFLAAGIFALVRQIQSKRKLRSIIDQQVRTEEELRESQRALSERTLDLIRSNEDLQAFAYSVSHDLREPVRNQSLYSELLERRYKHVLPAEALEHLRVIRGSAVRMQEMMTSLLAYSRVGQSDRPRKPVDCTAVVNGVLEDLRLLLAEAGAQVDVEPLPTVSGWEDRLHQVFQNLIENAVKYRRADVPAAIRVSAVRMAAEWQFSVSDNGIGFKQEYADKVFGLFKRLHGHKSYGGSGIGLALCKRVVERHGGRMWAESREGEGSTFHFTVPVQADELRKPSGLVEMATGSLER